MVVTARQNGNHRAVVAAALGAGLLVSLSGLIYRAVAAPVDRTPLDPHALTGFPIRIGEWMGQEVPIDPDIKKVIDADAYVSRRYTRRDGRDTVALYLPCGANVPALLQHIPENCYVGGGWTLVERRPTELTLASGRTLPCSIVQFARTGLGAQKLLLLHFLVADGEYFTTFSAVAKARGWRHFAGLHYAAQVQIVTSAGAISLDAATKLVTDFACAAAPRIERLFRDVEAAQTAGGPREWADGESDEEESRVPSR